MSGPEFPRTVGAKACATSEERIKALELRASAAERRLTALDASLLRVISEARRSKFVPSRE